MDATAWIDLLLSRSKELRSAGVLAIGADGCSATLAPADPDPSAPADRQTPEADPRDALHDPASYADGDVPGFVITRLEE